MAIGILFFKNDNTIHQIFNNITSVQTSKIEFKGGSADGYNENEISVIVVEGLLYKEEQELIEIIEGVEVPKITKWLEDSQGNKYTYGDTLPEGLIDLSEQFKKPTIEDLTNKTIILSEENATLKQELANTNAMLLEFMENNLV